MRQAAAELQQRLVFGVAVSGVLGAGVRRRLTGEFVLEFEGEEGQAVEEEDQVERVFGLNRAVMALADERMFLP